MNPRSLTAGLLLVLGALLSVPASIAVWQDRQVLDEDRFVASANEALDDNDVQAVLAARMADAVVMQLESLTGLGGTSSLSILQSPLVGLSRSAITDVCLTVLRSDSFVNLRENMLREAHRAVKAALLDDSQYVRENGERIELDLRPLIFEAVRQIGGEIAVQATQAVTTPDTGVIVLVQGSDAQLVRDIGDWMDRVNPLVPIVTAAVLLLAIAAAHRRVRMLGIAGGALALVAVVTVLLLEFPVRELATGWPQDPQDQDAARATYEAFFGSFVKQEVILILLAAGTGVIALAASKLSPARRRNRGEA